MGLSAAPAAVATPPSTRHASEASVAKSVEKPAGMGGRGAAASVGAGGDASVGASNTLSEPTSSLAPKLAPSACVPGEVPSAAKPVAKPATIGGLPLPFPAAAPHAPDPTSGLAP